jgi:alpha-1,3-rhamnosyltransferase
VTSPGPPLSVIVLCRNYSRFVTQCLQSVFAADQPCELVFVDNGSVDDSVTVANAMLERAPAHVTPKVIALRPEVPLCRFFNTAIAASSREIVKPISADDVLGPNFFSAMRTLVQTSDARVGVWLAGSVIIDDAGDVLRQSYDTAERFDTPQDAKFVELEERQIIHNRVAPKYTAPSMFYRRRVYDEVGGYDERFRFEDRPFLFNALKAGWRVVVHPYNNTYYRVHGQGISANPAWMAEARIPILVNHALRASWRNKPHALFHLARNVRVVARDRWRAWRTLR